MLILRFSVSFLFHLSLSLSVCLPVYMMTQNKPHSLEAKRNSCSSLITPKTLAPIGMTSAPPIRPIQQQLSPRFSDYALQQNSAKSPHGANRNSTRITIPHGLTTVPWDSPLSSPPPPPPWAPSLPLAHDSFIPSSPPYPLDCSTTAPPSLFSDYQDISSDQILPDPSKDPLFKDDQYNRSYTTDNSNNNKVGRMDSWAYYHTDNYNNGGNIYSNSNSNNHHLSSRPSSLYTMPEESADIMMHPPPSPFNTPFFFNASHSHTLPRYQNDNNRLNDNDHLGDDDAMMAFPRTRSKSSAPAFDIWYPSDTSPTDLNNRWLHQSTSALTSTINNQQSQLPPTLYTPFLSTTESQRLGPTRRFSVQPSSSFHQVSFPVKDTANDRRHSMAGPTLSHDDEPTFIMTSLADSIDELTNPQPPESIDNEPPTISASSTSTSSSSSSSTSPSQLLPSTSTTAKGLYAKVAAAGIPDTSRSPSNQESKQQHVDSHTNSQQQQPTTSPYYILPKSDDMGKGIKLDSIPKGASFYVVEFKAGRTDLYFSSQADIKIGDLVMVEADRGHDLGKVTVDAMTLTEFTTYTQQQDSSDKSPPQRIKRLFRVARPEEVSQLMSKNEEELKALATCQARVQQRKLNISVVNAEFQMDRRKLIFYFIAERRVDFRELVRDLFKVYKTRIWMCAVNNKKVIKNEDAHSTS